jgi:hypothetical protein
VPFWIVALALATVLAIGLAILERLAPWRGEIGADVDGLTPLPPRAASDRTNHTAMPRGV